MQNTIGYEFLRQTFAVKSFDFAPVAKTGSVTRVTLAGDLLLVPASVAPSSVSKTGGDILAHLLFALKHEGTYLPILAQVLPLVDGALLANAYTHSPTSSYIRVLCYLWEYFSQQRLAAPDVAKNTATALVFDPERYITTPPALRGRDARWHVCFNGLGSLAYCPTVRRNPAVLLGIADDTLAKTAAFTAALPKVALDRALEWAYLHETESSFAIEREAPSQQRAQAFVALLQQAHDVRPLTEPDWTALQNAVISNRLLHAIGYRQEQNWLRGPGRGALGVSYVPPSPDLAADLIGELQTMTSELPSRIDAIVAAAVCSFGFVFIHPFMDGNGRLSRFLFHHALCQSGRLPNGLILPVSVAMQRREADYLTCLQTFSKPARQWWQVTWIDEGQYQLKWQGHDSIYRYWDATACAEFGLAIAKEALEVELQQEADFLARYDAVYAAVNERFDVQSNDLATLILSALGNEGVVSKNRRKQFADRVPEAVFDVIEQTALRESEQHKRAQ